MPVARKKHRSKAEWIRRHVTDPYVKEATRKGYRSRAAFKLAEIDARDKLLRPGAIVVDLGAAPGSWTQLVRERLTDRAGTMRGRIIALDVLPMEPISGVEFIQGDFRDEEVAAQVSAALAGAKVDVVLSDMAPNLSGIAPADAARNAHLAELAIEFAGQHLKTAGALLLKSFQGSGHSQVVETLKRRFASVAVRKPAASRAESAETYLLARGLKKS
ncbi:MAG TPA: RlmE family RNA methyltransferase [Burkholderiaceae bacterium]|nr:RlmE family RNA methyltransferase [Burkholderiaceae bacterium]